MNDDPTSHLRISDADRELVLQRLQDAMARGMITADELAERSDRAIGARTRGEIEPLTVDLPGAQVVFSGHPVAHPADASEVLELGSTFGSVERKGFWVVPRRIHLRTRVGSTELDFTQAQIDHPVVDIEIDIKGGSVEMRLPEGASASMDNVDVRAGSIEDHRRNLLARGNPHFNITGTVRWGSIEVRGPRRNFFNWMAKQ